MATIDKIDFSKLKPYNGKVTRSFEQLCYQCAQKEFGHLGKFTPIDGSGGDGGVEFYLQLPNGEKWGWQCKFFSDTGRLNSGNRKTQIQDSLETACRNHSNLTRWILCLKTDLTEDSIAPDGSVSRGEQHWFRNILKSKIPVGRTLDIEHWGESKFLSLLNSGNHVGIRSFFFGELEFSMEWFKKKFTENFEKVKDKYDQELHTIDKYTKSKIDFLLLDPSYNVHLNDLRKELLQKTSEIETSLKDFRDEKMITENERVQRESYYLTCREFKSHIELVFEKIDLIEKCFLNYDDNELSNFKLSELTNHFFERFNKIDFSVFEEKSRPFKDASTISYLMSDFGEIYQRFFGNYFHERQSQLHFIAEPAKGKTHVSCDTAFRRIGNDKPAIFITGDKFTDETSLTEAVKKILEVPSHYVIDDVIQALDIYGEVHGVRVPIIIDGLNETTFNRMFSPIWGNHLSGFSSKVAGTKNLVLITTCRKSYKNRIWNDTKGKDFHYLFGFDDYETIHEAVSKYFNKYNLKADLFFARLEKFKDPIFLKIFCEIKNPNRKSTQEIAVNVDEESTYDIFQQYLSQVNARISRSNPILKESENFLFAALSTLARFLWINNLREIPLDTFFQLIDGSAKYEKDKSKAEILIHEGLVVTRDIRDKNEFISFTYDILAGYLVAEYLIKTESLKQFTSDKFIKKIVAEDRQHPLFEDVVFAVCMLLPQLKSTSMHELIVSNKWSKFTKTKFFYYLPSVLKKVFDRRLMFEERAFSISVSTLFKLPAGYVLERDLELVTRLFHGSDQNKTTFLDLSFKTLSDVVHPLNARFFSRLIESMSMSQRDLIWTEYVRKKTHDFESLITEFETQCISRGPESSIVTQKQKLLLHIIVWVLTCTNRSLRDHATRALYHFGRKFPSDFFDKVCDTLSFNDPYVWERTLCALYGVTMAEHRSFTSNVFQKTLLPEFAKKIYNLVFAEQAKHSTTHILARDYARRTIEIALIHHPTVLSQTEILNLRPPYKFGGIRNPGEHDYGDRDFDYSGPIQMDFSNYTIGRIVKDGGSYSNPPEKVKVRKQIYWRIYDLGWNEALFKEAERGVSNDSYYHGRTERAKVERYGKKYSWIAFFENAGLRSDLGLLDDRWDRFRMSNADIDPSFPCKLENKLFFKHDTLGDRSISLFEWYSKGDMPFIEEYLSIKNPEGAPGEWICLDGFLCQEDVPAERRRFTFLRGLLVEEKDYEEIMHLLAAQNLGGRWLPEKHENYYTYAGEMYYCEDSMKDNVSSLEFTLATKKVKIKKGEPGYYHRLIWDTEDPSTVKKDFPDEIETEVSEVKEFEVLLPVMEYNWENYHSQYNEAGQTTVVGKEIASLLQLVSQPDTFDLFELSGTRASLNFHYYQDYNNNHNFVYLRKDLLDRFLAARKLKFIRAIWGEREVSFKTDLRRKEFFDDHKFEKEQVFQKIVSY